MEAGKPGKRFGLSLGEGSWGVTDGAPQEVNSEKAVSRRGFIMECSWVQLLQVGKKQAWAQGGLC